MRLGGKRIVNFAQNENFKTIAELKTIVSKRRLITKKIYFDF